MKSRSTSLLVVMIAIFFAAESRAQAEKSPDAVSFEREVKPILRKRCGACHNAERPRGELDLSTFSGVTTGGAGGPAAIAGKPDQSPIYTQSAHLEEPKMPPNAPKIPQREIDAIRRWIEGGLIESAGDAPAPEKKAEGLVEAELLPRGSAITALAVSPVAPLAAVSGHRQILIFNIHDGKLQGALRFPEGDLFCLKFSNDGQTLLAAGGEGAESGKVVLFQTKTWTRGSTLGDETDVVLAADLAPNLSSVAFGGPGRVVKVAENPKGSIVHTFRKPTDWVTATSYSPDGLLIAAGDRFGGLFLWEARSGQEFLVLPSQAKAITALGWNESGDSLLAGCEDGAIRVFDINTGKPARRWDAHAGGVLSIQTSPSGRVVSSGRDRLIKIWELDGKLVASLGPAADQTTRVAWSIDGRSVVSGDLSGEVRVWNLGDSSSKPLVIPRMARPAAVALVAPVLTPAKPSAMKPLATNSRETDDLQAALTAAREAASSAERTISALTKLARSRPSTLEQTTSTADALRSAKLALSALEAAQASDPGNASLERALAETQRAVETLERQPETRKSTPGSTKAPR